jgi:hypothetical protein
MRLDASSEFLIRRYLLSSVSEEEREQVETRLMTDDDFFQQINLVEDELVEEYLDEELTGADRSRFEDTFLCAPERQHKLRFCKAMRVYAANAAKESAFQDDPEKHPWFERFVVLFKVPRPVLAYSFIAALLMLSGGGAWMLVQMRGLKEQISGLQAQQQNSAAEESRLRALYDKEHARADQIAGLLQQEREQRVPTPFAAARQPSFTVFAGAQRSAQSSQTLKIQKDAILVELRLDLAQNWKVTYRAELWSGEIEILTRSNLKAEESEKEIAVSFSVPARDLPSGYCLIRLYGSGENEVLEIYSFRVARN